MTPNEQDVLDILSDKVYVMVSLKQRETTRHEQIKIKIQSISERMTKDEIMNKYHCLDLMHYPAHYKTPETPINFWIGGPLIFAPYIPLMMHKSRIRKEHRLYIVTLNPERVQSLTKPCFSVFNII